MQGRSVITAVLAALGNGLQGWDNSAIAGSLLFIVAEFQLPPGVVGVVVSASLLGAVVSTCIAGPAADAIGRRNVLSAASALFLIGQLLGLWSPNVEILTLGRGFTGVGIGLIATVAPLYIAECSPSSIRGQLATLPQLMGIAAMILSYLTVFFLSLSSSPNWRIMLGLGCIPSLAYALVTLLILPESPRWLASQGKMHEARLVLELLRGADDVSGELALLVEGLSGAQAVSVEEWVVKPVPLDAGDQLDDTPSSELRLFTAEEDGVVLIAEPVTSDVNSDLGSAASAPSARIRPSMTEVVSLMDEVQNGCIPVDHDSDSVCQAYSVCKNESEVAIFGEPDDLELAQPLLQNPPEMERNSSCFQQASANSQTEPDSLCTSAMPSLYASSEAAREGWQLAWTMNSVPASAPSLYTAPTDADGSFNLRRIFLVSNPDSRMPRDTSSDATEQYGTSAFAIISQASVINMQPDNAEGPAMIHPAKLAEQPEPLYPQLMAAGVLRALVVGVGLQVLQQASGVNAVMYYTPTILMASGGSFLESFGLSSESSSIFASMVATAIMLPFIFIAMQLMDKCGRRSLLLATIPVMTASMAILSFGTTFLRNAVLVSITSLVGLVVFSSSFVMGFGPIPNIICSEIFPTRVRGICLGLCGASMWISNIIISQAFPWFQHQIGFGGVFGLFGIMSAVSWLFVYTHVPETKGLPLEVICDIFATPGSTRLEILPTANKRVNG